tara:strand:+ start:3030 stop:4325 length:1296 start_codon:yes stop_codon:yes gene_type:complete
MSGYIKKPNKSVKQLFYGRTKYYRKSIRARTEGQVPHANLVNYHIGEFNLYGKVNPRFVPILLDKNALRTFSSNMVANPQERYQAVHFVVRVFEQMAAHFQKCAMSGRIRAGDPFLSTLKVHKAYADPRREYDRYFALLSNTLKTEISKRGIKIITIDDFMTALMGILPNAAKQIPFTQVAYTKSKYCSSRTSGLVIEIADLDYNNDEDKIKFFYNSPNWDFYVQTCNSFGFVVDSSAPWRLMADLDSEIMLNSQRGEGIRTGVIGVMTDVFKSMPLAYFDRFERDLYNLFLVMRSLHTTVPTICAYSNRVSPTILQGPTYTFGQFNSLKSAHYYFRKYFEIRFLEEESTFTDARKERLISDSLDLIQVGLFNTAIQNFEIILNKPFDYIGSLSYINRYKAAKDAYEREHAGDLRQTQREILREKQRKRRP